VRRFVFEKLSQLKIILILAYTFVIGVYGVEGISYALEGNDTLSKFNLPQNPLTKNSAIEPELFVQTGHAEHIIASLVFSPNDRYIVSKGFLEEAILWDVHSGNEIRRFFIGAASPVVFSSDNKSIFVNVKDERTLVQMDVYTGDIIQVFVGGDSIWYLDLSPDGQYLVGADRDDGGLIVWSTETGEIIKNISLRASSDLNSVKISPDGKNILVAGRHSSDGYIYIIETATGKYVWEHLIPDSEIKQATFLDSGRKIVYQRFEKRKKPKSKSEFYRGGNISIISISSKESVQNFDGYGHRWMFDATPAPAMDISKDDKSIVIRDENNNVVLLNILTGEVKQKIKINLTPSVPISPPEEVVKISNNSKYLAYSAGSKIFVRDITNGEIYKELSGKLNPPYSLKHGASDDAVFIGYSNGSVEEWDMKRGERGKVLSGLAEGPSTICISTDGQYLLGGNGKKNMVWDLRQKEELKIINLEGVFKIDDCFIEKNLVIAVGEELGVGGWELPSGKYIGLLASNRDSPAGGALDGRSYQKLSRNLVAGFEGTFPSKKLIIHDYIKKRDLNIPRLSRFGLYKPLFFTPNNKYLITIYSDHSTARGRFQSVAIIDIENKKLLLKDLGQRNNSNGAISSIDISLTGRMLLNDKESGVSIWSNKFRKQLDIHKAQILSQVRLVKFSKRGDSVFLTDNSGSLKVYSSSNGKELIRIINFTDGEWIVITPEGFFNASPGGAKNLKVRSGASVLSIDKFYNTLYRPDLVMERLQGDTRGLYSQAAKSLNLKSILEGGLPPTVKIVSPAPNQQLTERDVNFQISVQDQGGGIGKIVWRVNGITIGIDDNGQRGIQVVGKSMPSQKLHKFSKLLSLAPGENLVEVFAYNKFNQMASSPDKITLKIKDKISNPPKLYVMTIGINNYRDKALQLKYAVPDAKSMGIELKKVGAGIYEDTFIKNIWDDGATLKGIDEAFKELSSHIETQDVFILYMAGHGLTQDGRYHFLPYDFRYRNEESVTKSAINQDHLQKWLSTINARKSLVLIDTCNSGSFTQALAVQRGMAEKTAINKLTRATGRTTIVASTDDQPALEGYKGHGLFTYVLLNALKEADKSNGNTDGMTGVFELAGYMDENVPEITFKAFGFEQIPQVNIQGRDFPIGMTGMN
jgi:WD40 repeat protein